MEVKLPGVKLPEGKLPESNYRESNYLEPSKSLTPVTISLVAIYNCFLTVEVHL